MPSPPAPRHARKKRGRVARALCVAVLGAAAAGMLAATSAGGMAGAAALAVDYDFTAGYAAASLAPDTPPPGAGNFTCEPSTAHPYPVILVNGTFENMDDNWQAASPLLVNHGYCVFAFNYGGVSASSLNQGTGEIAASAGQLASFVTRVLTATGAAKVDLVGHSQGGMMPRYYIDFLGGAVKVDTLVGLAPPNYGTTADGIETLASLLGAASLLDAGIAAGCEACAEQEQGSSFLAQLNATPTVASVRYTVIESDGDEVVTPYTNAFLPAAPNVTNITVNRQCPRDLSDHLEITADPVALADVLNALDPARPVPVPCVAVLPLTGPVGLVPSS